MARRNTRSQLQTINEINMTPLIDLTFLLLIIFMITAPLLQFSLDVSPPEMNADPITEENSRVVDLNRKGELFFDERKVSLKTLTEELAAVHGTNPAVSVLIRADGERRYNEVIKLMRAVKDAGISSVSLVTSAEN